MKHSKIVYFCLFLITFASLMGATKRDKLRIKNNGDAKKVQKAHSNIKTFLIQSGASHAIGNVYCWGTDRIGMFGKATNEKNNPGLYIPLDKVKVSWQPAIGVKKSTPQVVFSCINNQEKCILQRKSSGQKATLNEIAITGKTISGKSPEEVKKNTENSPLRKIPATLNLFLTNTTCEHNKS